jgi:hypothetical protein
MGDAGVVRLAQPFRLQDAGGLQRLAVALVRRRVRDVERQRVVDARLRIFRVAGGQLLHGLLVGEDTGAVVDLVVVAVEGQQRRDVVGLALGFRADLLGLLERGEPLREVLRRRRAERIVE